MPDPRLDSLRAAAPGLRLATAPAELEHYGRDWTRRWTPAPLAVALPANAGEVQTATRRCTEVARLLEAAEDRWLVVQAELEAIGEP